VIFDTKTPFLIKLGQENHLGGSVNRVEIGKNILGGILGPRRARGRRWGWGWDPVPAGAAAAWSGALAVQKKFL
jgi:hypothetical protein